MTDYIHPVLGALLAGALWATLFGLWLHDRARGHK